MLIQPGDQKTLDVRSELASRQDYPRWRVRFPGASVPDALHQLRRGCEVYTTGREVSEPIRRNRAGGREIYEAVRGNHSRVATEAFNLDGAR